MRQDPDKVFLSVFLALAAVGLVFEGRAAAVIGSTSSSRAAALPRRYAQAANEQVFDVEIQDRQVSGDLKKITVRQGDSVRIRWTTDEATEAHLHGYNVKTRLEPGQATEMKFEAHATGRFAITSHGFGNHAHGHHNELTLLYVEVYP